MKSRVKLILRPVAISVVAALAVYGCGNGVVESVLGGGGGGVVVAGAIANSPIDRAPLKATCADGTAGGTGISDKGTYSMTVTCASTNFPVVISIDETALAKLATPPMMAGADLQFCTAAEKTAGTCDDVPYKTTERAPLKVAVPSTAEAANVVNMNAVTTLAAQPIEDKTAAFKADPTKAKPTAADVATAETAMQTALGISGVRNADPVSNPQVARINAQVLEAVAVTKQLSASAVKPEDVMKAIAAAANTGGAALTDASGSFDIAKTQTALTTAAGLDATKAAAFNAVNTALTDTKAVEGSIKGKGSAVEQIVIVVGQVPSVQTWAADPRKNTLASGTIANDIKTELDKAANKAAKGAAVSANLATQAVAQAIAKVQEIEADTTILTAEKSNRKKAVFEAAESIRASVEKDVTAAVADAAVTNISADQQARALAQVAMAVNVAGDQIKTEDITKLFDNSGKGKSTIDGMAQRISTDIAAQIATKTAANLGDVNVINPATVIGAANLTTITTAATNVITALADFSPPPNVGQAAVQIAVNAVIGSMGATANLADATVKTNIQNTITTIATNLNTALGQQVTVGGVTTTMSALPDDSQLRLLAQTAAAMMEQAATTAGTTTLDFATPPQPGSVTIAVTEAVNTVNTGTVTFSDSPSLTPEALTAGTAIPGFESCSAEVKVRGINVGVPIKVMAFVNGQAANTSISDPFAPPPAPGTTVQPNIPLPIYVSVSGGVGKFFPSPAGLLVGMVNNEQSFRLCVIPNAPGTYQLSAQIGSRYDFATNQFAEPNKLKSISFETVAAATVTTTPTTPPSSTTTSTTAGATSTTLPPCDPLAPPPTPGQPLTCEPVSSSTSASTTSTAATTTSTAATTSSTAATTSTTLPPCDPLAPPPTPGQPLTCQPAATTTAAPTTTTTVATTTTTAATTTTTTTTAATTTTTTTTAAATTTTVLGEAACKVTSGATTAYVTGAPSCASSGTGSLGLNGLTATVTSSNVPAGVTAIAYTAVTQACDPFAAPPSPGAAVSSLLCKN